jgi:hypothetical protein
MRGLINQHVYKGLIELLDKKLATSAVKGRNEGEREGGREGKEIKVDEVGNK